MTVLIGSFDNLKAAAQTECQWWFNQHDAGQSFFLNYKTAKNLSSQSGSLVRFRSGGDNRVWCKGYQLAACLLANIVSRALAVVCPREVATISCEVAELDKTKQRRALCLAELRYTIP